MIHWRSGAGVCEWGMLSPTCKHERRGGKTGGVDLCLLEAIVPGRFVANIFNISQCRGGDKQMKAIRECSCPSADVEGCTGTEWEQLTYSHIP